MVSQLNTSSYALKLMYSKNLLLHFKFSHYWFVYWNSFTIQITLVATLVCQLWTIEWLAMTTASTKLIQFLQLFVRNQLARTNSSDNRNVRWYTNMYLWKLLAMSPILQLILNYYLSYLLDLWSCWWFHWEISSQLGISDI